MDGIIFQIQIFDYRSRMSNLKPQILYVDDEPSNLLVFRSIFLREYEIVLANSGEETLEILKRQAIKVIITDQRMPGMSGSELAREVANTYPGIPHASFSLPTAILEP